MSYRFDRSIPESTSASWAPTIWDGFRPKYSFTASAINMPMAVRAMIANKIQPATRTTSSIAPSLTAGCNSLHRFPCGVRPSHLRRQALGHFDFRSVVHGPRDLVRHCLDQAGGGWVAVAALLDAAERQVHLCPNAGQVHITHAKLALL